MTGLPIPVPGVSVCVLMNRGCCGPFARFDADFEPPGSDGGLELLSTVSEQRLPAEFLPAIREGLVQGLGGVSASVLLTDGYFHETDSWASAYRIGAEQAGRAALIGAGLLPPEEAEALRWVRWPGSPKPRRPKRSR
ncbi:Translation elongation factors (GTPases) [Streptomyces sp. SceaMP-e96]|uniref:hypothetical protein n=1 Tax=unclassified Streptomyces TaxID=2593676 RepID=UPI000823AEA5|nr:hypothetical protein [Streptomyces sp. SID4951]SCK57311.1 Translation elongation factors (GTPases) [Streptomyces sp. SceaMP-e96]